MELMTFLRVQLHRIRDLELEEIGVRVQIPVQIRHGYHPITTNTVTSSSSSSASSRDGLRCSAAVVVDVDVVMTGHVLWIRTGEEFRIPGLCDVRTGPDRFPEFQFMESETIPMSPEHSHDEERNPECGSDEIPTAGDGEEEDSGISGGGGGGVFFFFQWLVGGHSFGFPSLLLLLLLLLWKEEREDRG